jgi:hypothetical protein
MRKLGRTVDDLVTPVAASFARAKAAGEVDDDHDQ